MSDLISRQDAIDAILHNQELYSNNFGDDPIDKYTIAIIDNDAQTIAQLPSAEPERKKGKWIEKHHAYSDEESVIEEWQSCKCSECGRYDTRPYLYMFSEPKFCSWCGARMDGENEHR